LWKIGSWQWKGGGSCQGMGWSWYFSGGAWPFSRNESDEQVFAFKRWKGFHPLLFRAASTV
jgi:hypothetical protein